MQNFRKEEKIRRLSFQNNLPTSVVCELLNEELPPPPNEDFKCKICEIQCLSAEKLKMHIEFSQEHQRNLTLQSIQKASEVSSDLDKENKMPPPPPSKSKSDSLKNAKKSVLVYNTNGKTYEQRLKDMSSGMSPNRDSIDYVPPPAPKAYKARKASLSKTDTGAGLKLKTVDTNGASSKESSGDNKDINAEISSTIDEVQCVELWNSLIDPVEEVVETVLTIGILEPKELPFIGSGTKLFRFIGADYWVFGNDLVIKILVKVGNSTNEQVLLLNRKSITKKIESNNALSKIESTEVISDEDSILKFISARLQMNSKGELILIETSNDALCDTSMRITEYRGISDLYTTTIPKKTVVHGKEVVSHPEPINIEEFAKTKQDITDGLDTVRRNSLEILHIHENLVSQITNIRTSEA